MVNGEKLSLPGSHQSCYQGDIEAGKSSDLHDETCIFSLAWLHAPGL